MCGSEGRGRELDAGTSLVKSGKIILKDFLVVSCPVSERPCNDIKDSEIEAVIFLTF